MFVFVQCSFTDVRTFTSEHNTLLDRTKWESPTPTKNFARNLGVCVNRKDLTVRGFIPENYFFSSRNGFRSPKVFKDDAMSIMSHYNHYLFDGSVLAKFEFIFKVLRNNTSANPKQGGINKKFVDDAIANIMNLEFNLLTRAAGQKVSTPCPLQKLSVSLKELHIRATTRKPKLIRQEQSGLIAKNQNQIIVSLEPKEKLDTGNLQTSKIADGCYSYFNKEAKVLLLHYPEGSGEAELNANRNQRILHSRLFIEKECLNNVFAFIGKNVIDIKPKDLTQVGTGPSENDEINDRLQKYLDNRIKRISDWEQLKTTAIKIEIKYQDDVDQLKNRISELNLRKTVANISQQYIQINHTEIMESKFNISGGQIGQVGDNTTATGTVFNQNVPLQPDQVVALNEEVSRLLAELNKKKAAGTSPEIEKAVEAVTKADQEDKKDGNKILEHLKAGGKWLFDFAKEVGVKITTEYLKSQMGLP
ncbi:MAG: hypothetical protein ABIN80_26745 [Dyadobacter sp.]|uniref:hypothetical protein n=1 Tax=Dyadobacter sp. TaxID=1914288 RepID=UPI003264EC4D